MKKNLLALVAFFVLCALSFGKEIKIGVIMPLSGPIAVYGQTTYNGMKLAIQEINENGGIDGNMIKLIVEDNKGDSAESVTAFKKLANVDKIDALLGPVASSNCLAVAPVAQEYGIPMMTSSGTSVKVTQVGDFISRACFIDPFQGSVMANFAKDSLNAKTAIIFKDVNSDYSEGLTNEFTKTFTKRGGEIITVVNYVAGDIDFSSQLTKIRKMKADVVFVPGYYNEAALIVNQARDLRINSTFLGADGWDNGKLFEIAGEALNGSFVSTHFSSESEDEIVQNFINNYFDEFFEDPNVLSALGYDAAKIMAEAFDRANSTDKVKVKNAINSTKNFKGVTGIITLDENRNANKSAFVMEAKNGAFVYKTTVDPVE
jgi:branched-chain amino acid transport system substrate-binding protein